MIIHSAEPALLTPALRELLQASFAHNTTSTEDLAGILCLSPHTVHTSYKRICSLLHVYSRSAAVIVALKRGDIVFTRADPPDADLPPPRALNSKINRKSAPAKCPQSWYCGLY